MPVTDAFHVTTGICASSRPVATSPLVSRERVVHLPLVFRPRSPATNRLPRRTCALEDE